VGHSSGQTAGVGGARRCWSWWKRDRLPMQRQHWNSWLGGGGGAGGSGRPPLGQTYGGGKGSLA
jgi:hypothetical protein